jgi:hypothetical protein
MNVRIGLRFDFRNPAITGTTMADLAWSSLRLFEHQVMPAF